MSRHRMRARAARQRRSAGRVFAARWGQPLFHAPCDPPVLGPMALALAKIGADMVRAFSAARMPPSGESARIYAAARADYERRLAEMRRSLARA